MDILRVIALGSGLVAGIVFLIEAGIWMRARTSHPAGEVAEAAPGRVNDLMQEGDAETRPLSGVAR